VGVVSDVFSSPSKQAQSAAQNTQNADLAVADKVQQYYDTSQQNERTAIAGLGSNPYLGDTANATAGNPYGNPIGPPQPLNPYNTTSFSGGGVTPAPVTSPSTQKSQPVRRSTL
jgi:hypothetical protein